MSGHESGAFDRLTIKDYNFFHVPVRVPDPFLLWHKESIL